MQHLKTITLNIAYYETKSEPKDVPKGETADIVRVHLRDVGRARDTYEFVKNPPNWGSGVPGYKWKPYRRVRGPIGWLVEEDQ